MCLWIWRYGQIKKNKQKKQKCPVFSYLNGKPPDVKERSDGEFLKTEKIWLHLHEVVVIMRQGIFFEHKG